MDKLAVVKILRSSQLRSAISALLLVLLIVLLTELFWSVASILRTPTLPPASVATVDVATGNGPDYSVQSLLAVPLFGEPPKAAVDEQTIQKDIKRSRLKITVLGVVAGSKDSGVAILRHGSKTKAYGVGEKIEVAGAVKLLAVMPDHIVIENNRKQEKIELQKRRVSQGISATATPAAANGDVIDLNRAEIRDLIGDPRQTIQNSPLRLARFFAASPVMEGEQLIGYEMKPGRDPRLFKLLDLKPGDVVLSVNGQSLSELPTTELMKLMETTQSFELLVQRNNTILSKRLDI